MVDWGQAVTAEPIKLSKYIFKKTKKNVQTLRVQLGGIFAPLEKFVAQLDQPEEKAEPAKEKIVAEATPQEDVVSATQPEESKIEANEKTAVEPEKSTPDVNTKTEL